MKKGAVSLQILTGSSISLTTSGGVMGRRWAQPHLKLIWFGSFFVLLFFHCTTTDWQKNVKQRGLNILQWLYNSMKSVSIWLLCMTCCDRKTEHWQVSSLFLKKKKKSGTDLTESELLWNPRPQPLQPCSKMYNLFVKQNPFFFFSFPQFLWWSDIETVKSGATHKWTGMAEGFLFPFQLFTSKQGIVLDKMLKCLQR